MSPETSPSPEQSLSPKISLPPEPSPEPPIVMGILNRTPDSFYDAGEYWGFDDFLRKAEQLAADGADMLDVGGVKAAPGSEVTESEELERVVPAVEALAARFDLPLSIDTWRASVADEAYKAGASLGNDISGFADTEYLQVAAEHGAAVVACHVRLAPRYADPNPVYADLFGEVKSYLAERVAWAEAAGIPKSRVYADAGLDLGKTPEMSAEMLRRSGDLGETLGCPVLLSASNKGFLGVLCDAEIGKRGLASAAAHALGTLQGCKILRVHDVRATRVVIETIQRLRETEIENGQSSENETSKSKAQNTRRVKRKARKVKTRKSRSRNN